MELGLRPRGLWLAPRRARRVLRCPRSGSPPANTIAGPLAARGRASYVADEGAESAEELVKPSPAVRLGAGPVLVGPASADRGGALGDGERVGPAVVDAGDPAGQKPGRPKGVRVTADDGQIRSRAIEVLSLERGDRNMIGWPHVG